MGNGTIKELPVSMRPYEKCLLEGAQALSDTELLAVIIKTGAKGLSSIELAANILKDASLNGDIGGITNLTYNQLVKYKGIGWIKALQVLSIIELSRRLSKSVAQKGLDFSNPETIADYYMEDMRHLRQEQLIVVMLDTKLRKIADQVISKGTIKTSIASPREIFIAALQRNAVYIVLLHNHPSGDPTPSRDDIELTKRMAELGKMLNVELIDHIIIGDNTYESLKSLSIF